MLIKVTAEINEETSGEIHSFFKPIWAIKKANSPTWAKFTAIIKAVLKWSFKMRLRKRTIRVLNIITKINTEIIKKKFWISPANENNEPIETKNIKLKIDWSGLISVIISWCKTDSEIIKPAKNAPSVEDTPSFVAKNANSKLKPKAETNTSSFPPTFEIDLRIFGKSFLPINKLPAIKIKLLAWSLQQVASHSY